MRRGGKKGGGRTARWFGWVQREREGGHGEREEKKWRGVQGWRCCWMLYSWLIQRDSPRDASRSSNKALPFSFFFPLALSPRFFFPAFLFFS